MMTIGNGVPADGLKTVPTILSSRQRISRILTSAGARRNLFRQIPADFPWHLFVSFVGPHDPFDPPTEYADKYRNSEMPPHIADDMHGKPEWVKQRVVNLTPEEIAVTRRQYCAATELIDRANRRNARRIGTTRHA